MPARRPTAPEWFASDRQSTPVDPPMSVRPPAARVPERSNPSWFRKGAALRMTWRYLALAAIAAIGATGFVASATTASAAPVSNCRPSAAHPFPVVLVHGTFENSTMWSQFQPVLRQAGYCVSAIDYIS